MKLAYTMPEAVQATGISREVLLKAARATEHAPDGTPPLPAKKIGTRYLFPHDDLTEWIRQLPDANPAQ